MYRTAGETEDRSILVVAGRSEVRAFDRATGELRWRHEITPPAWDGAVVDIVLEVAIIAGRVFVVSHSWVYCFEYATGAPVGKVALTSRQVGTRPSLLADGDHLYVAVGGALDCISLDGTRLWSAEVQKTFDDALTLALPGNVRQGDRSD